MAYGRNKGFFFYGFWAAIFALAILGLSTLYQKPTVARQVGEVTVETVSEGIERMSQVADKAVEDKKTEMAKEAVKEATKD